MRKISIVCAVASLSACAFAGAPQRISYPGTLDASMIAGPLATAPDSPGRPADPDAPVHCIVEIIPGTDIEALVARFGGRVNTVAGNHSTIMLSREALVSLAEADGIVSVQSAEVRAMADEAARMAGVEEVRAMDVPYTGDGVIVGVIDSGFDYRHAAFRDANGACRIAAVWDQRGTTTTAGHPSSFGYGIVADTAEDILRLAHDSAIDTHGTHVAGIAASSADVYTGMAPGSTIVLVSCDMTDAGVADALHYLLDYADEAGRPLAVNLSLGTLLGFRDGSDALPLMLDGLMAGREGCILSVAAGNEGHRRATIVTDDGSTGLTTRLLPTFYGLENIFIGGTADSFSVTLTLHDANGEEAYSCTYSTDAQESLRYDAIPGAGSGASLALSTAFNEANGCRSVGINLFSQLPEGAGWTLRLDGEEGRYIVSTGYGELSDGTTTSTIASTACGHEMIAVGALTSRSSYVNLDGVEIKQDWRVGEKYFRSGEGPTFDGRVKPDVMAPGAAVVSAVSAYVSPYMYSWSDMVLSRSSGDADGRPDYWGAMSGTSMATPVVTGVTALWLEADPTLSVERVRTLLTGMDCIDAKKGLEILTAGIETPPASIGVDESVTVYDLSGTEVSRGTMRIATAGLLPGLYIIRGSATTAKTIIR